MTSPSSDAPSDAAAGRVHWSFWVIGGVMLIWNVMGAANYVIQMDPDALNAYRDSERAIIDGRPIWATAAFAIAVFGGALGCLLLLLRKSAASYVFMASLLGVIVTMIHTVGIVGPTIEFSPFEIFGIILMPLLVAAFLLWYAKWAERKGWIS